MNRLEREYGGATHPCRADLRRSRQLGFSMIEMLIVLCIAFILLAFAVASLGTGLTNAHINQAYDTSLTQLRIARERAIEERKQYIVCFGLSAPAGAATPLGAPTAQTIQLFRWDYNTAIAAAVQISSLQLPNDVQFQTIAGIPTNGAAVPDGFGAGLNALDFDQAVAGGNQQQVMFLPDGSARDINLNLNSGVMYLAKNGQLYSSRAITLFGASGRIRGWQLVQQAGVATWIQQ